MSERRANALESLSALDQAIARRGVSKETRNAVRRTLLRRAAAQPFHARLRWWPAFAFVAGAAMMALLSLHGRSARQSAPDDGVAASETTVAVFLQRSDAPDDATAVDQVAVAPPCGPLHEGLAALPQDRCAVGDGVRVEARSAARFDRDGASFVLHSGELAFDVDPRPHAPLHIRAGEVDVQVIGTRFVLHHGNTAGWISMDEGEVLVRISDAPAVKLGAGERLDWPGPDATATAVKPSRSSPRRSPRPSPPPPPESAPSAQLDDGLTSLLDEVARLRRRGAYREAVQRLRTGQQPGWNRRARQLVSYEIGTLLERQLSDDAAACKHWREHQRLFKNGRYDSIVTGRIERLGCDDSSSR